MKKRSVFIFCMVIIASCNKSYIENIVPPHTEVFRAHTEITSTKTSLNGNLDVLWNLDDRVSVFFGSQINTQYKITDESAGNTSAVLIPCETPSEIAGNELDCNIAFYPYDSSISIQKGINYSYDLSISLPTEQTYVSNSFGSGTFPMIAVTASSADKAFAFKNICGVLKLQILGVEKVRSIIISGNDGEVIAGKAIVHAQNGDVPSIEMTGDEKCVFLNCGKDGIQLSKETGTVFEIALPPIAFAHGFTATIVCTDGQSMNIKTTKNLTIERSCILKMAPITFCSEYSNLETGLPIVIINTLNSDPILNKTDWLGGANITILKSDKTLDYQGILSIKGRGNTTWNYPKKPYAIKLDKKSKILGMSKNKRWCLLANWMDRTLIRNATAFEISRKTSLAWTPRGQFVELILNGKHLGNYYLCEQIKVDENRVNITELNPDSEEGEGLTGGYLFELDTNYDELFKFRPTRSNYPWMFKDPDEVNEAQFTYVQNYVNEMEDALYDSKRFSNRDFAKYMDLESFADWLIIHLITTNYEFGHPKSCYMHKDMNGKMIAGPVWDFDWGTFNPEISNSYSDFNISALLSLKEDDAEMFQFLYYPKLFKDDAFRSILKSRWLVLKPVFETEIPEFISSMEDYLQASESLNSELWPITSTVNGDENLSFHNAINRLQSAFLDALNGIDLLVQQF